MDLAGFTQTKLKSCSCSEKKEGKTCVKTGKNRRRCKCMRCGTTILNGRKQQYAKRESREKVDKMKAWN